MEIVPELEKMKEDLKRLNMTDGAREAVMMMLRSAYVKGRLDELKQIPTTQQEKTN